MQLKLLICILCCSRDLHRVDTMKNLSKGFKTADFLVLMGSDRQLGPVLDQKNHILYINCEDKYELLPKKMSLAYDYIYNNMDYDYVMKIDTDTWVNFNNLKTVVTEMHRKKYDYVGGVAGGGVDRRWHFGKCTDPLLNQTEYSRPYNGDWCGGGFGYILSRRALKIITKKQNREYLESDLYEDKAIGDILRKNGIIPQFEKRKRGGIYKSMQYSAELTSEHFNNNTVVYDIYEEHYPAVYQIIKGVPSSTSPTVGTVDGKHFVG